MRLRHRQFPSRESPPADSHSSRKWDTILAVRTITIRPSWTSATDLSFVRDLQICKIVKCTTAQTTTITIIHSSEAVVDPQLSISTQAADTTSKLTNNYPIWTFLHDVKIFPTKFIKIKELACKEKAWHLIINKLCRRELTILVGKGYRGVKDRESDQFRA